MGLRTWADESRDVLRDRPLPSALRHIAHEFYLGGLRRVNQLWNRGETHWDHGDWDVLVICDACRVDLFREFCTVAAYDWLPKPEVVDSMWSVGTTSDEWMAGNFDDRYDTELARTAYLTGNGFVHNYDTDRFALFRYVGPEKRGAIEPVPPEKLTDLAIDAWRRRADLEFDRMIVHYMQPHTPFRSRPDLFDSDTPNQSTWGEGFVRLRDGDIDREEFWTAYLDNLVWLGEHLDVLQRNCEARLVLSADHGNGFGEWGVYGHPFGMPVRAVREVPWVPIEGTDTGTHEPAFTVEAAGGRRTRAEVRDHLESLGYVT